MDKIKYPYYATKQRCDAINAGFKKIKKGMALNDVKQIMGEADIIRPLYEPKKYKPKVIGTTHWYYIKKLNRDSELPDSAELVRISYDKNNIVIAVDRW